MLFLPQIQRWCVLKTQIIFSSLQSIPGGKRGKCQAMDLDLGGAKLKLRFQNVMPCKLLFTFNISTFPTQIVFPFSLYKYKFPTTLLSGVYVISSYEIEVLIRPGCNRFLLILISHVNCPFWHFPLIVCFLSDDHSRVYLDKIDDTPLSDFINANHVDVSTRIMQNNLFIMSP